MKLKQILFAFLAVVMITTVSCKKDDTPFTDALSNTTFVGTTDGVNPAAFKFFADGKVTFFTTGLNAPAAGQFKGSYTYANGIVLLTVVDPADVADKSSFSGTLTGNTITGTYGHGASTNDGGAFSITKQ